MKAAVFVRYHSGDGAGHVGWAFDAGGGCSMAGSVENHSGHMFTPAKEMGYWQARCENPRDPMRERAYDDAKVVDVPSGNALAAYRTMLWIEREAYRVIHRNCEDDVYDVLRAYGAKRLPAPLMHWFPKSWFHVMNGRQSAVAELQWPADPAMPDQLPADLRSVQPWCPPWRRPWHVHFHLLKLQKIVDAVRRLAGGAAG